jgi:hypothetical protein
MTLNETLLQKLDDWRPPRDGRQTLLAPDEGSGWAATVTADRHDDMSTAVWEMMLRRSVVPTERSGEDLKNWAQRVTSQVTGLLEPLDVVEIDLPRDMALLRSQEPTRRGSELFYYEVLLSGISQATVRRYRARPHVERPQAERPLAEELLARHREQIPFTLTHEVLAKFAADLAAQ